MYFQAIRPKVEFQDGITVPHFHADSLNGSPISQYMLTDSQKEIYPVNIIFEDADIYGDVILDANAKHSPNLKQTEKDSIKLKGGR